MINRLRKKIIVFAAVVVCSVPLAAKKVNAAEAEVLPTAAQPSQIGDLTMIYFPEAINNIILKYSAWKATCGNTFVGIIFNRVGINQGSFKVTIPGGLSLTISSSDWFQIRLVQTQVRGGFGTFTMPAIEYRNGEAPPVVAFEGPESEVRRAISEFTRYGVGFGKIVWDNPQDYQEPPHETAPTEPDSNQLTQILPERVIHSPDIPKLKCLIFNGKVNTAISQNLLVQDKSRITTIVSKSITSSQSPFHEVFEYSEDREEFFSSGEDDVIYMIRSEGTWFRIRVMESTCDGITYYSPIVEYRDGDAPPKCFVIE